MKKFLKFTTTLLASTVILTTVASAATIRDLCADYGVTIRYSSNEVGLNNKWFSKNEIKTAGGSIINGAFHMSRTDFERLLHDENISHNSDACDKCEE